MSPAPGSPLSVRTHPDAAYTPATTIFGDSDVDVDSSDASVGRQDGAELDGEEEAEEGAQDRAAGVMDMLGSDMRVLRRGEWWSVIVADAFISQHVATRVPTKGHVQRNWNLVRR